MKIGNLTKIRVLNPLYHARHRFANGWNGPEFEEYVGIIVDVPWMGQGMVGLDDNGFLRVFSQQNIVEMDGTVVIHPSPSLDEVKTYTNSQGKIYTVRKRGNVLTCDCPGYTFRRTCKHVKMFEEL